MALREAPASALPPGPPRWTAALLTVALASLSGLAGFAPPAAGAQDMDPAGRRDAVEQLEGMNACVQEQAARFAHIDDLLDESREQARSGRDAAVRRDALAAIEALLIQAEVARTALLDCVARALPDPGGRALVERRVPLGASERRMLEDTASLHVFEMDAALRGPVRVVRAQQVDGEGALEDRALQRGVRRVGEGLERCFRDRRRGPPRGTLDLVFRVSSSGEVSAVEVERSEFDDTAFHGCVERAGARIRVRPGARGGSVTVSYRLQFG